MSWALDGRSGKLALTLVLSMILPACSEGRAQQPSLPPSSCNVPDDSPFLLLEISDGEGTFQEFGNSSLLGQMLSPASTVKLALARALLDSGFDPGTEITVNDAHIANVPRAINLSEALLYSSNDYFRILTNRKGKEFFRRSVKEQGFFPAELPPGWPSNGADIVHGAGARTQPVRQLVYMRDMLIGDSRSDALLELIQWPMTKTDSIAFPGLRIYGKTGAWDKTVWFVGGARMGQRYRSVVIVRRGHWKTRKKAIALFYCRLSLKLPVHPLIPH